MAASAIAFFLLGAVLGWGFRVWVLVPTAGLGAFSALVVLVLCGNGFWSAVLDALLLTIGLQLGYLFGAVSCALLSHKPPEKGYGAVVAFRPRSTN